MSGEPRSESPRSSGPALPVVLIIEDEEWVARLLEGGIREAGYQVLVAPNARAGLDLACAAEPDCIVCDVTLPDNDGFWVASELRAQPDPVAVTPFLFLSTLDDPRSRLASFAVGGDVFLTKPFRLAEVVAQLGALVQMARRLREARQAVPSSLPAGTAALSGDLGQVSMATLLTVLEMERRTGTLEVVAPGVQASVTISQGFVAGAMAGGASASPDRAVRAMLAAAAGRFWFRPLEPGSVVPTEVSIGALLASARVDVASEAPLAADEPIDVEADMTSYRPPPGVR